MENQNIQAIIFDLGGVLINIDYHKTADAFKQLGLLDFDEIYTQLAQTDLFDRFECGLVSPFHFINRLLDQLPTGCNGNQVVHAWNAMIMDFPTERLKWLESFGKKHRIFLLSNTNSLHVDAVNRSLKRASQHANLEPLFEKVYFSHEMGMRKPNPEIFLRVCSENGLNPSTTLFIDDSPQHIEGAKEAGLPTIHCTNGIEEHIALLDQL